MVQLVKEKDYLKSEFIDFESQYVLELYISARQLPQLFIKLSLLQQKLISYLLLNLGNISFQIYLQDSTNFSVYENSNAKLFKLFISSNSLEMLCNILLNSFKNGYFDIGHIDIDFNDQTSRKEFTLIPTFSKAETKENFILPDNL